MKRIIFYSILLINIIFTQDKNFDISNILVIGNTELSEEDIINFSGLSSNSSVNAVDISNAVHRLWLLNRFQNIQIDIDQNYETINLIINVEEAPILDEIFFKGNYFKFKLFKFKKSKSEFKNISNLNSGSILSQQKINTAINLIKEDFIKRNYHSVEIKHEITNSSNNRKNILFNINVASKSKIKNIQISINDTVLKSNQISRVINSIFKKNNTEFSKNKILKILKKTGDIKKRIWYLPWTGHYDDQKLENMSLGLINYYRNQGYLDFNVF